MILMILITDLNLMDENFLEILMVIISFLGFFGLLVSIFSPFGNNGFEDYQIIVDIMVSILLIVYGSIYSNFILFRALQLVRTFLNL